MGYMYGNKGQPNMGDHMQVIYVWVWANLYPDYTQRMAAMSHPANVHNAFIDASFLFLQPKG